MPPGQSGRHAINILVTGHRGYIGSILVRDLLNAGYHNITGIDSDLYRNAILYDYPAGIKEVQKDIRDISIHDLSGIDTIIHLAGLSNDPLGELQPQLTYDINLEATVRLAKIARSAGVTRFVFSSSCSVYGASLDVEITEESEVNPVTTYAKSKYLAETELSRLADNSFCPVFLRNATVFGLSPKLRFDLVVNNLVAWAYTTGNIFLKSDGTAWRPLFHVGDVSSAIMEIIAAPVEKVNNQVFNIGSSQYNFQILEIAKIIKNIIPGTEITFARDAEKDIRNYNVSFRKFKNTFPGFRTRYPLEQAVIELHDFFRKTGLKKPDFEGPRFNRIECIKYLLADNAIDSNLRWNMELIKQAV